jgi:excinuclease UvrABC nuclease subunit
LRGYNHRNFPPSDDAMPFQCGPFPFTSAGIEIYAPMDPGVYGISSEHLSMIYVGQSQNILKGLRVHHNDESHCIWRHKPTRFYYESAFRDDYALRMREEELISEYDPLCD